MSFGSRLREARKNSNLTQEQLGCKIGVAKSSIAGYEKGTASPTEEKIISMMRVLNIDANYLWQDSMPDLQKKEAPTTEDVAEAIGALLWSHYNRKPTIEEIEAFKALIPVICKGIESVEK